MSDQASISDVVVYLSEIKKLLSAGRYAGVGTTWFYNH